MRKKSTLLQLMFMLLFILVIVGFTPVRNIFDTNAQNVTITPTYGCLSPGCPGGSPTVTPTLPVTSVSPSPSVSVAPSATVSAALSPTITQPCTASASSSLTGITQSASQVPTERGRGGRGGHHHRGGFLKDFFQFFLLLLELMLKLGGGATNPCSPAVTPAVSVTPVSSIAPSPSISPIVSPAPTTPITPPITGTPTSSTSIFTGPFGNTCTPGQVYCNGHVITGGQNNTLYYCQPHSAPTVQKQCSAACKVNASGNDAC